MDDYEPANLTPEQEQLFLMALFGSGTITSPSENTRQWVWRAPTKKEMKRIIREGGPKSFTLEREQE